MNLRKLGSQGLAVSPLGIGCMGMASETYGPADEKEAIATLHEAFDLGVRFIDTSDIYGPFRSEQIVGKALKGRRDKVVVGTKFGIVPADPSTPITEGHKMGVDGRPSYVRSACDASLQRLGVDHIDIYYQHRVDPDVPIEETVGALAELVHAGKIRHIGLSEASATIVERAHTVHPVSAVQAEYSLWSRDIEDHLLPTLRRLGIGVVAYSPLGRGFLSGRIRSLNDLAPDDYRRVNPRFMGENFQRNLDLLDELAAIAEEMDCTTAALALAWVLGRGADIAAIPGAETRVHLRENAAAAKITLTDQDLQRIEKAFPKDSVAGDRYPAEHMPFQG
ncbi:aldo/keto reductase [Rhodococcus jostii]|uniref:Aldo/keto reductase n=1 Tax=Rhodococcus jostii TaxID=132919 RepID=A0ABU4CT75_RHOJO|nr:aldo/keto reductase [Rhodococcus jostii]MDV6286487.1 aldo/keto reductase [Rhodococcus jostii]